MSVQFQVHEFLASVAKGVTSEWVPMDPGRVADQTGITRNKVNKTLFNLMHAGKIELQRGENGRSIIGYRLLVPPPEKRAASTTNVRRLPRQRLATPAKIMPGQTRRRSSVPTPHLDEYATAKTRFDTLATQFGELVEARFHENPYAEEGLLLRDRLVASEAQWIEMRTQLDEANRELRALRGRRQTELREVVEGSGSGVVHAED